ncbi:MAG: phosphate ABC transporter permease subunit PstC [Fimbriimonadaceae bacterium]|nr:phosphate ABC transporter permease subunit PstC [Fimbriimonadaceae bacterium]
MRADKFQAKATSRAITEWCLTHICLLAGLLSIVTTFGIVFVLFNEARKFFAVVSPAEFFFGRQWEPMFAEPKFGALPLMAGTFQIAAGSALVALPIGLLIAIYLSEYASPRIRRVVKPALEILAGIPTVVYGFLGLTFVTPILKSWGLPLDTFNALSGAIVVGIMIVPLVTSLSEDAIAAVPKATREAAYGLGASKAEVITNVVLKSASSGIAASFILAISRAVGETMAVTLAAGARPNLTLSPFEQVQTMTAYIAATVKGDVPYGSTGYQTIFAVGFTLFAMTLSLNLLSMKLVKRLKKHHA